MGEVLEVAATADGELDELVEQLATCEMQRNRLLARVASKDEEFGKERAAWKRREAQLLAQIKELRRG